MDFTSRRRSVDTGPSLRIAVPHAVLRAAGSHSPGIPGFNESRILNHASPMARHQHHQAPLESGQQVKTTQQAEGMPVASSAAAERQGFEPWVSLRTLRFSRPVHSAALPPLRELCGRVQVYTPADDRQGRATNGGRSATPIDAG